MLTNQVPMEKTIDFLKDPLKQLLQAEYEIMMKQQMPYPFSPSQSPPFFARHAGQLHSPVLGIGIQEFV